MGYIPYNPAIYSNNHVHTDPKTGLAVWVACHVLPLLAILVIFLYNKIRVQRSIYDTVEFLQSFFGMWLAAVLIIDAIALITLLIMYFL